MNQPFGDAAWIWSNSHPKADEYSEFVDDFTFEEGKVVLRISADSNYAAYVNGQLAAWGQYADFPYDKVYDEVDITAFCTKGQNRLAILVWYYGDETLAVYYPGEAGLLYAVWGQAGILCKSDGDTQCRMSRSYINHRQRKITSELGFGYFYDFTKEDDWLTSPGADFHPAVVVPQVLPLRPRPCAQLILLPEVWGTVCNRFSDNHILYDLGSEQVGFLSFVMHSCTEQEVTVAYGEHIADGQVRRILVDEEFGIYRDFSVSFEVRPGKNVFLNPFRRLGCRYLEVFAEKPVEIEQIGIRPTVYPLEEAARPILTEKQNQLYTMCVETLKLCMHEHYEDCPWREQALYTMDSRNQMLCGYYAFKETRFARASLQLISKDRRDDGLLSICFPMKTDFVIPSFTLHYITECKEYLEYSGDLDFLREIYPKLVSVVEAFTTRLDHGLVAPFTEEKYWNFYEWGGDLDGQKKPEQDLIINALLSLALKNLAIIADRLGYVHSYPAQADALNQQIRRVFWDDKEKICYNYPDHKTYSQLGNALAILCEAVPEEDRAAVCLRILEDDQMVPASLSMHSFVYDAWLKVDPAYYRTVVLDDIDRLYTPMISSGGNTVWETVLGEQDFKRAGSLCHGWSAIPIYYYHQLLEK